jgi:hypothetical protein
MASNDLSGIGGAGSGGISSGPGGTGITITDVYTAYKVEYITVTLANTIAKEAPLGASPVSGGKTQVTMMEGVGLQIGVDYNIDTIGNLVQWNGLQLDGLIQAGDKLRVVYFA